MLFSMIASYAVKVATFSVTPNMLTILISMPGSRRHKQRVFSAGEIWWVMSSTELGDCKSRGSDKRTRLPFTLGGTTPKRLPGHNYVISACTNKSTDSNGLQWSKWAIETFHKCGQRFPTQFETPRQFWYFPGIPSSHKKLVVSVLIRYKS